MILILSPSKSQNFKQDFPENIKLQKPPHTIQTKRIVEYLKGQSVKWIEKTMKVSEKIANLNYERFQEFSDEYTKENSLPAALAYTGDVYGGFDAASLPQDALMFANKHIKLLSGLYGITNTLDSIQPYRLEMGTSIEIDNTKNLYELWSKDIAEFCNKVLEAEKDPYIINCASKEYSSAISREMVNTTIVDIEFKEKKGDTYKIVGIYAKKARGMMARFMCENKITKPQELKRFASGGYEFNNKLSTETVWVFTR